MKLLHFFKLLVGAIYFTSVFYLRKKYNFYLLDLVPSFSAAFIFTSLFINHFIVNEKYGRLYQYLLTFLIITILIIEEFNQILYQNFTYDKFDIIAILLGGGVSLIFYEFIKYRSTKN